MWCCTRPVRSGVLLRTCLRTASAFVCLRAQVNPLDKIASLQQQENITGVYKGGLLLVDRYSAGAAAAVEAKAA